MPMHEAADQAVKILFEQGVSAVRFEAEGKLFYRTVPKSEAIEMSVQHDLNSRLFESAILCLLHSHR